MLCYVKSSGAPTFFTFIFKNLGKIKWRALGECLGTKRLEDVQKNERLCGVLKCTVIHKFPKGKPTHERVLLYVRHTQWIETSK